MALLEFSNVLLFFCLLVSQPWHWYTRLIISKYAISCLIIGLYNITFHPLAKIPGPRLRGAFYFPTYWGKWTSLIINYIIDYPNPSIALLTKLDSQRFGPVMGRQTWRNCMIFTETLFEYLLQQCLSTTPKLGKVWSNKRFEWALVLTLLSRDLWPTPWEKANPKR